MCKDYSTVSGLLDRLLFSEYLINLDFIKLPIHIIQHPIYLNFNNSTDSVKLDVNSS